MTWKLLITSLVILRYDNSEILSYASYIVIDTVYYRKVTMNWIKAAKSQQTSISCENEEEYFPFLCFVWFVLNFLYFPLNISLMSLCRYEPENMLLFWLSYVSIVQLAVFSFTFIFCFFSQTSHDQSFYVSWDNDEISSVFFLMHFQKFVWFLFEFLLSGNSRTYGNHIPLSTENNHRNREIKSISNIQMGIQTFHSRMNVYSSNSNHFDCCRFAIVFALW